MKRHSPARPRSPFDRLLALSERVAGLFRNPSRNAPRPSARLALEAMEDRVVPDGRPLPFPAIFASAGAGLAPVVKAYDATPGTCDGPRRCTV